MNEIDRGRKELFNWLEELKTNSYEKDADFRHTISFYLSENFADLDQQLQSFADTVIQKVIPHVQENSLPENLPRIADYDAIGKEIGEVVHHPAYETVGNCIYGSDLMKKMAKKGGLSEALAFLFLSSFAGEAGHNCPIACSAGIIRVLQKVGDIPEREEYLQKLTMPSFTENYTGAQFVTEVQGGSDVGKNDTHAAQDASGNWRITGEKWFCSNANADLILMTARFDPLVKGTKGLGLFLVPAKLKSGERNHYSIKRLKDKLGTRTMATGEIEFHDAHAIPMGPLDQGFNILMENVLHLSRLFNTICVTGMAKRAYQIAEAYAKNRIAFDQPILHFPLVQENLARIKAENTALIAFIFATLQLQDTSDLAEKEDAEEKMLLRLLANLNKYLSALWTVEHIHHCLDVLAGNGTIETFSAIPLLLRDAIICENWEGTHNVLRMQTMRDILRYQADVIFLRFLRSELDAIDHPKKALLEKAMETLAQELETFKSVDSDLQMLQIKEIVDQMAILFAAVHLLKEAIDQEQKGSSSKMKSFDYFVYLHLREQKPEYHQEHLELIRSLLTLH